MDVSFMAAFLHLYLLFYKTDLQQHRRIYLYSYEIIPEKCVSLQRLL